MSRAERRAYQRMNKNQDRYALPVAPGQRARMEKVRAKRAEARATRDLSFTPRYILLALAGAFLVGLIAFSLQWSNGPMPAVIAGVVVALIWIGLAVGWRLMQRRSASR
ncbi:MAG TPA: hypothetical protein VFX74_02845 [Candidatus Limnocylindria bacterium]|jgi:protein-S-isoprenylcysteine O-methyltransferase Ste14|nr:hypothetical protein [Candidatus Limnocylindria bacterium]